MKHHVSWALHLGKEPTVTNCPPPVADVLLSFDNTVTCHSSTRLLQGLAIVESSKSSFTMTSCRVLRGALEKFLLHLDNDKDVANSNSL